MANETNRKIKVASTALVITIAGLASSAVGVGRQSDIVVGTTTLADLLELYFAFKLGTSPAVGQVEVYLIADDNHATNYRSDGAGPSDAAITILNANPVLVIGTKASPSTGDIIYGDTKIKNPPPNFGIAIVHNTTVNLDATGANHYARYALRKPELQP